MKLHLEDKQKIIEGKKSHRLDTWPEEAEAPHWDRNFQWVNGRGRQPLREQINPCRPPPGWRLLDPFEYIEKGDIYWHNCDLCWSEFTGPHLGTPYFYGFPFARKE